VWKIYGLSLKNAISKNAYGK